MSFNASRSRRMASLAIVLLMVAGVVATAPARADTAWTDAQAASAASTWLSRQLVNGGYANPLGGATDDYGLMIDAEIAMYASGDGALAAPIINRLDEGKEAGKYFTYAALANINPDLKDQGKKDRIGGATAKVLVAAEVAGRDPHNFGGYDMVHETQSVITKEGTEKGRVRDEGPNITSNNANTFGQALAVMGLAGVGKNDSSAIKMLTWQQCSKGYFRIFYSYDLTSHKMQTCDEGAASGNSAPDRDSTGIAVSALIAAREAGASDLDEPINKAVAWLVKDQTNNGGFAGGVGTEEPNSNSTGLVVQALASAGGNPTTIEKGATFLRKLQANPTDDAKDPLSHDLGAIAYSPKDYKTGQKTGLSAKQSTWLRATAQAALGLSRTSMWRLIKGEKITPSHAPIATPGPQPAVTSTITVKVPAPILPPAKTTSPSRTSAKQAPNAALSGVETGPARDRLARYLASFLVHGDHIEAPINGQTYVDYDATADVVLALRALDRQPKVAAQASEFLLGPAAINAYAHGAPYETAQASYAEPLAKLTLIAAMLERERNAPESLGTLLATLHTSLRALQNTDGVFEDHGEYGDKTGTIKRHALAMLALEATDDATGADLAAKALEASQCGNGGFPTYLSSAAGVPPDPQSTAWAIQALASITKSPTGPNAATTLPQDRRLPLEHARRTLAGLTNSDGMIVVEDHFDLAASSAVAAGRQAAGIDASDTARSMATLVLADGGVAPAGEQTSDFASSLASADGVAGGSWIVHTISPVAPARGLIDMATVQAAAPVANTRADGPWATRPWALMLWLLLALGAGRLSRRWLATPQTPDTAHDSTPLPPSNPGEHHD